MSIEQKSLKQIIDHRKDKLGELRKRGINPYPSKFNPTHLSESIISNYSELEGEDVVLQKVAFVSYHLLRVSLTAKVCDRPTHSGKQILARMTNIQLLNLPNH